MDKWKPHYSRVYIGLMVGKYGWGPEIVIGLGRRV